MAVRIAEGGSKGGGPGGREPLQEFATDAAPRAHGPGALWSQPVSADGNKKNQIASRFVFFVCIIFFKLGTALSNVRRDGVI